MSKKRILVVDDETSITRLLKLNLEQTGNYEVREENFGARVLEAAREFKPDLVLLDVMLPDMDGGDVAAGLKQDPALRKTPVVFLTAAVKKEELGAPHASEIPFIFGTLPVWQNMRKYNDSDQKYAPQMQEYWTNFAKTGDPNGGKLVKWPKFDAAEIAALKSKDDLVTGVQSKYQLDKTQAQKDVDAFAKGRQL